jgi:hypothetical protein
MISSKVHDQQQSTGSAAKYMVSSKVHDQQQNT